MAAPAGGFEPPTKGLTVPCATVALRRKRGQWYRSARAYRASPDAATRVPASCRAARSRARSSDHARIPLGVVLVPEQALVRQQGAALRDLVARASSARSRSACTSRRTRSRTRDCSRRSRRTRRRCGARWRTRGSRSGTAAGPRVGAAAASEAGRRSSRTSWPTRIGGYVSALEPILRRELPSDVAWSEPETRPARAKAAARSRARDQPMMKMVTRKTGIASSA